MRTLSPALLPLALAAGLAVGQDLRFADLGDLRLENGAVIRDCRIGYRTFGVLNADTSNAVLFPTWFTGTTDQLIEHIGAGKLVDPAGLFVIAVDALGNGVSTSPSNSQSQPGGAFPRFTIRDMVNSQHRLVTEVLGIHQLKAVVGISMGGMQTFEWIVAYPGFVERAVPVVGSPKLTSYDHLLWRTELKIIELGRSCDKAKDAMGAVAAVHAFALETPAYRVRQTSAAQFPEYLARQEAGARMAPEDWAAQLRAMLAHDVSRSFSGSLEQAAKAVRAKLLVVAATQDHMVNAQPAIEFAGHLKAEVIELGGDCGHLAFGCEAARVIPVVSRFLNAP